MKFKEMIKNKKLIGIILSAVILVGAIFSFKTQSNKINELERQISIEQNITDQNNSYTETEVDTSTIERKFNNLRSYKIFSDTINIKHADHANGEKILGLKSKVVITATEDYYYQFNIDLSEYEIVKATDQELVININKPYLDEETCHGISQTYHELKDECSNNMLSNKEDTKKAQVIWQGTFETKSLERIKSLYGSDNEQKNINKIAKSEIKALLRDLGYAQNIKISIKGE